MSYAKCIIMQGLPGSGKSTLARALSVKHDAVILSTDDYPGLYRDGQFHPELLGKAHTWNQERADRYMGAGKSIIVDNTNTQNWECKPYVLSAQKHGAFVMFEKPTTPWATNPEECARKTTHGVPLKAIMAMDARMETLSSEACMAAKAPWE
jgi:NEDD4-binding protein 2